MGGNVHALTMEYQRKWDENRAELATLEAEALALAIDNNQEKQMLVHDSVTLNKRKALANAFIFMGMPKNTFVEL